MTEKQKCHGGARTGAGRPRGQGPHGEATKPLRVPLSLFCDVQEMIRGKGHRIPYYAGRVPAGQPSAASAEVEEYLRPLDLIPSPYTSFIVEVRGDSMINAGIFEGDLLVVDSGAEPRHGQIVVASVAGETTVKRLHLRGGGVRLLPENENYAPVEIPEGAELVINGVVATVVRRFRC